MTINISNSQDINVFNVIKIYFETTLQVVYFYSILHKELTSVSFWYFSHKLIWKI